MRILHDALLPLMLTGIAHDPRLLQKARQRLETESCLPSQQVHLEGLRMLKSSRHRLPRCLYRVRTRRYALYNQGLCFRIFQF